MSRLSRSLVLALAGLMVGLVAVSAMAQPPRGGRPGQGGPGFGGVGMLLRAEKVQQALNLTDEEKTKLREAMEKVYSGARGGDEAARAKMAKDLEGQIEQILGDKKFLRLKQIELQVGGIRALSDPDVAEALGLTDAQKQDLQKASEDLRSQMRGGAGGGASREQMGQRMQEYRQKQDEKIKSILNAEQQKKYEEMKGEPANITMEDLFQGFRGRGGDQGGPGGQRGGRTRGGQGRGGNPQT